MVKDIDNGLSTQHKRRIIQGAIDAWDYFSQKTETNYDLYIQCNLGIIRFEAIARDGLHITRLSKYVESQSATGDLAYKWGWDAASTTLDTVHTNLRKKKQEGKQ